jgi:hypothetical protein
MEQQVKISLLALVICPCNIIHERIIIRRRWRTNRRRWRTKQQRRRDSHHGHARHHSRQTAAGGTRKTSTAVCSTAVCSTAVCSTAVCSTAVCSTAVCSTAVAWLAASLFCTTAYFCVGGARSYSRMQTHVVAQETTCRALLFIYYCSL